jgi:hypothetical protein
VGGVSASPNGQAAQGSRLYPPLSLLEAMTWVTVELVELVVNFPTDFLQLLYRRAKVCTAVRIAKDDA